MKYYIKMYDKQFNRTKYKQYKCIDGFNANKELCWKFSKQGALKIIERLTDKDRSEYRRNLHNLEFSLEAAE